MRASPAFDRQLNNVLPGHAHAKLWTWHPGRDQGTCFSVAPNSAPAAPALASGVRSSWSAHGQLGFRAQSRINCAAEARRYSRAFLELSMQRSACVIIVVDLSGRNAPAGHGRDRRRSTAASGRSSATSQENHPQRRCPDGQEQPRRRFRHTLDVDLRRIAGNEDISGQLQNASGAGRGGA